jgi:hypothetical protein
MHPYQQNKQQAIEHLREGFEEPVKSEDRELCDILLDALVHIVGRHPVVVQTAEKVSVFLFAVDLPFRGGVVELQLLHRIFDGQDLLQEE